MLRVSSYLGIVSWVVFLTWFVYSSLVPPTSEKIQFYSTESCDDLKFLIGREIRKAKESIHLASFGLSDPEIETLLQTKEENGIKIEILADGSKRLGSGIMHRKVIAVDRELLLLGSTNLTLFSLEIHRNLVVAIRSRELFTALLENTPLHTDDFSYYPLPEMAGVALSHFIQTIDQAKSRIFAAIYTFTHPEILNAFIRAKERGVDVRVYLDRSMSRGASKELARKLLANNIPVKTNLRDGLLHYKCALIDNTFLFGSANWTKAAFAKNQEYLIIFPLFQNLRTLEKFFHSLDRSSIIML